MQKKEYGIILRRFANNNCKFSVLTKSLGKIILVILNGRTAQQIQPGSFVQFQHLEPADSVHFSNSLTLELTVLSQTPSDLMWMHHILEICYYFIPQHQPAPELFTIVRNYLILIANNLFFPLDERTKKLYVGAILFLIGFFPPSCLEKPIILTKNSLLLFVDFDKKSKVQFLKEQSQTYSVPIGTVDDWLLSCIQTHPRMHMFKTMQFIYK